MMDRLSKSIYHVIPEYLNYGYRRKIYLRHVRYWNYILDENKIDLAIFQVIPHDIYDYIIYHLCKLKNIPMIILTQTKIIDSSIFFDDFEDNNIQLRKTYNQLRKELKNTPESEIQLSERSNDHFKKLTEMSPETTSFYLQDYFLKKNFTNLKELHIAIFKTFKRILKPNKLRELKLLKNSRYKSSINFKRSGNFNI